MKNDKILQRLKQIRLAACPPATKDIALNLKNRQQAIDIANYGPENPNELNFSLLKHLAQKQKHWRCGCLHRWRLCYRFFRTQEL